MNKAFWTLLCRDEMRDRYTKQYPPWYANVLARSLAPYGIDLYVLTDQAVAVREAAKQGSVHNIHPCAIVQGTWGGLKFRPSGWWNKLLFYGGIGEYIQDLLFVDLDSVFIKDPSPIFDYAEKMNAKGISMIHERAVFSWNSPVPRLA